MATDVPVDRHSSDSPPDLLRLIAELRERHLFKIAAAYAVGAWLVIQVTDIVGPAFNLPEWVLRAVIVAALVGFLATMGVLLFRPRRQGAGTLPIYLSRRARLIAGVGVLLVALAAAAFSIRAFSAREQVMLAVMPFTDLSPQRDKGFLAEGVAEEILSTLGKNSELKVLGRTSSWALRERTGDLPALRASLGVTHLLEGSIRAAGADLRLSVRLINTADGSQEWSEDYRGGSEDVFALQDRIAGAVAARLSKGTAQPTTSTAELTSADAYNLYLAARQIARTRTEPELKRAYALARKVVDTQPNFAPGHALLAELIFMLSDWPDSYGTIPVATARPLALQHARKAIELSPGAADGYAAFGVAAIGEQRLQALRKAMALDPARSELPLWIALELENLGRYKEALSYLERAAAIDPLWPAAVGRLSVDLNSAGYLDRVWRVLADFETRGGDKAHVARYRATASLFSGDLSEGIRWGAVALELNPALPFLPRDLLRAYTLLDIPRPATLVVKGQPIRQRFYIHGYDPVVEQTPLSSDLWRKPDADFFVYAAGAKRDWTRLAAFYDLISDAAADELCWERRGMAPTFIVALRETGRQAIAHEILSCLRREAAKVEYAGPRRIDAIQEARIAALSGDPTRAFELLDNALRFGWNGKSARLSDDPAFNTLATDARYAAFQRKLDEWLARERRETLGIVSRRDSSL